MTALVVLVIGTAVLFAAYLTDPARVARRRRDRELRQHFRVR